MAWRDRPRTKAERAGEIMEGAISLGEDVDKAIAEKAKMASAERRDDHAPRESEESSLGSAGKRDHEQDMREVVNLLRDLSITGGLAADQPDGRTGRHGQGGRPGPGGAPGEGSVWRTFSEN